MIDYDIIGIPDIKHSRFMLLLFLSGIPEKWNIQTNKCYNALIKNTTDKYVDVVFVDDGGQIINTLIAYEDFIPKGLNQPRCTFKLF